ncbi:Uncharacterized homolog of phage Mu protein gp47 [Klebsiella pneumoniae]|uniref:Uncharacterized homolog of phage Mu protein gp47 n=1 Tax=Klebsiella pneumoniae TaxID=573 RepID=A0A378C7K2_KLEPN|nr:Uncharacterized homolog of phage Mu protein gp47 [Klebsiella pneumoniae]
MQTQDGVRYHVTATSDPSAGKITVTVQADETGLSGNLTAGDVLTLISPVAGVNSDGVVADAGISGGADVESVAELLTRLLYRKRNPPTGGALHDYVIWATELRVSAGHGPLTAGTGWVRWALHGSTTSARTLSRPAPTARRCRRTFSAIRTRQPGLTSASPAVIEVWPIPADAQAGAADHSRHPRHCRHPLCGHPEPAGAVSFGLAGATRCCSLPSERPSAHRRVSPTTSWTSPPIRPARTTSC